MLRLKPTDAEIQQALYGTKDRANLEMQLLESIKQQLAIMGYKAHRRNVGASEHLDAKGKRYFVRYNEPGQSDLWCIGPQGIHIEIECKSPKVGPTRTLTSEQKAWLEECTEAGAIALCVSSIEEFVTQLKAEFAKRAILWRRNWDL